MKVDCDTCELNRNSVGTFPRCRNFWKAVNIKWANIPEFNQGFEDICWHPFGSILVVEEEEA